MVRIKKERAGIYKVTVDGKPVATINKLDDCWVLIYNTGRMEEYVTLGKAKDAVRKI